MVLFMFQTRVLNKKVLVLGHEGAQTEEQMPYLGCIYSHLPVLHFVGADQLCASHRARSSTQGSIGERISKFIERLVRETTKENRMLSDLDLPSLASVCNEKAI